MGVKRLVINMPNTVNLWLYDPDVPSITVFDPPLAAPQIGFAGMCVWGDDTGKLIASGRRPSPTVWAFFHYDPSVSTTSWTDKGDGSNPRPKGIDGTSYSNVWCAASGTIRHFDGNSWTLDASPGGSQMNQVSVCGTDLDEVFVAAHNQIWFRDSSPIGSGVWTDKATQLNADTGLNIAGSVPDCEGVFAIARDEVYFLIKGSSGGYQHWIVKWNGSSFSVVSTPLVKAYSVSDGSFHGLDANTMWWMTADPSYGRYHFVRFDGTNINWQAIEHNLEFGCSLILESASKFWAAGHRSSPERILAFEGDGGLDGWTLGASQTVSLGSGTVGVGLWEHSTPPYLQNQEPAPDSTGNDPDTSIYLEAVDDQSDLVASSIKIYVNETLAWSSNSALPGFSGTRVAADLGYGYTVFPASPFEAGIQTIRVEGVDADGNPLNESYSFETRVADDVAEVDVADVQPDAELKIGIDLKLNSHDLVVEDYDLVLVAGVEEVAQHLLVGLRLMLGEWYLDEDAGVPYYRDVFVNAPNSRVIEGLFRQQILGDADIEALQSFELSIDRATRHLDLDFTAVSSVGEVNVSTVFP